MDDYVSKPVRPGDLATVLSRWVATSTRVTTEAGTPARASSGVNTPAQLM